MNTSATDFFRSSSCSSSFDGKKWVRFGDLIDVQRR
jgi:hypothetical protein